MTGPSKPIYIYIHMQSHGVLVSNHLLGRYVDPYRDILRLPSEQQALHLSLARKRTLEKPPKHMGACMNIGIPTPSFLTPPVRSKT